MNFLEKYLKPKYAFFIILLLIIYSFLNNKDFVFYNKLKSNNKELKQKIEMLKKENILLNSNIKEIQNNKKLLEIKARSELGLVEKNEIIYEIIEN